MNNHTQFYRQRQSHIFPELPLTVKRTSERAHNPREDPKHPGTYFLSSAQDCILKPGAKATIKTDLIIIPPTGTNGLVIGRTTTTETKSLQVIASMIPDNDGPQQLETKVTIINHSTHPYSIRQGFRIAKLIISTAPRTKLRIIESTELEKTFRQRLLENHQMSTFKATEQEVQPDEKTGK